MEFPYKIVSFDEYCPQCKHYILSEDEEPCNGCLTEPVNEHSRKPVNFIFSGVLVEVEYEYPMFKIVDGNLIATYKTDNRNLTFKIVDGKLIADFKGVKPKLKIVDTNLFKED